MPVADNTFSRRAGIQNQLMEMWRQQIPTFEEQQKLVLHPLEMKKPTLRKAPYAWKESVPFPHPWPYGASRTYDTIRDRLLEVSIYPYSLAIPFSGWDEEDDQLGDLRTHLEQMVGRFKQLPDKLFVEFFTGVQNLNFRLPNAYDGVALHSALDGDGNNRFGVANGNILAGSGITEAAIANDFARAQRQFLDFLDPSGTSPIFKEGDVTYSKMHVIIPNELNYIFQRLSNLEYIRTSLVNTVSESNELFKAQFQYHLNPYLTDAQDWYIVIEHNYWKPFVYRFPGETGLRQIFQDFNNSDRARDLNEYALLADVRVGLGPWAPFTTIKINN